MLELTTHLRLHGMNKKSYQEKFGVNASIVCSTKRDKVSGEKNPAYNHGGRFSPFSKKFVKYQDGTAEYTVDDVIQKQKDTKRANPQNSSTTLEYWLARGFSEEEAVKERSKRQQTFSLDVCIEKYGEEEGRRVWQDRQDRWQQTLNDKSEEEKNLMNMKKAGGWGKMILDKFPHLKNSPGTLYYLHIFNDEVEWWKIGITYKTTLDRWSPTWFNNRGLNMEIVKEVKFDSFREAYDEEQRILRENQEFRIAVDYNGFKTTETFCKNIYES